MWLFDVIVHGWTAFIQWLERIFLRRGYRVLERDDDLQSLGSEVVLEENQDEDEGSVTLRPVSPRPLDDGDDELQRYVQFCGHRRPAVS